MPGGSCRLERLFGREKTGSHPALPILKARALKELLQPYLERAHRYRLIDSEAYPAYQRMINSLEEGYELNFERSAVIFDFSADGHEAVTEHGIEYHRVGRDAIDDLMAIAPEDRGDTIDLAVTVTSTLPKLLEASFQPSRYRSRTFKQEELDESETSTHGAGEIVEAIPPVTGQQGIVQATSSTPTEPEDSRTGDAPPRSGRYRRSWPRSPRRGP